MTGEKENGVSESDNREAVERFIKAADAQDWTTMKELYHSDAVEEWPQSGERLVGVDNVMAVNENYPGHTSPTDHSLSTDSISAPEERNVQALRLCPGGVERKGGIRMGSSVMLGCRLLDPMTRKRMPRTYVRG
jgi:hypothetical protein